MAEKVAFTVVYCPPDYPDGCFPRRCRHEPQFAMCADARPIRHRGKPLIQIDHSVCLACGSSLPCSIGGNILVDCCMLLSDKGARHWKIGMRVQEIRGKWARIARHLFNENGWNGRHEAIARRIDPKLTMRLQIDGVHGRTQIGTISFDPSYVRQH